MLRSRALLAAFIFASLASTSLTGPTMAAPPAGDEGIVRLVKDAPKDFSTIFADGALELQAVKPIKFGRTAPTSIPLNDKSQVEFDGATKQLTIKVQGTYSVEFTFTPPDGEAQVERLVVQVDAPAQKTIAKSITGGDSNPAETRQSLGIDRNDNSFRTLVVQMAKSWGTISADKTAKDWVARFDVRPEQTCTKIAALLRQTANDLTGKTAENIDDARKTMKTRFQDFYNSGNDKYLLKNPYVDDWKPFLLELEQQALAKIPEDKQSDPAYLQFVLNELAAGFDQLSDAFRGVTTDGSARNDGPYAGSGTGQGTMDDSNCRKRRRCRRCSSLLFGF